MAPPDPIGPLQIRLDVQAQLGLATYELFILSAMVREALLLAKAP